MPNMEPGHKGGKIHHWGRRGVVSRQGIDTGTRREKKKKRLTWKFVKLRQPGLQAPETLLGVEGSFKKSGPLHVIGI